MPANPSNTVDFPRAGGVRNTLADVTALDNPSYNNGTDVYVVSARIHYVLDLNSTAVVDGTTVLARPSLSVFKNGLVGPPVPLPGRWLIESSGTGGGNYQTVESNLVPKPQEAALNFSTAFTVTDNPGNGSTDIDLFTAFAITGFSHSPNLVLVGATVVSPSFTASYNKTAATVTLTDTEGHSDGIALPGTSFISPHTFQKNVYGQSVTFTDTASDGTSSAAANSSVTWGQNVYFGAAVDPGTYDSTFVNSLGSTLKLAPNGGYSYNASSLQSSFFCARAGFGLTTANFTVNGFPFACSKVATISVTNTNGIAESYDVFRSDNVGLGAFTLVEA